MSESLKLVIKLKNNNNNNSNNTISNITPSPLKRSAYDNTLYSYGGKDEDNDDDQEDDLDPPYDSDADQYDSDGKIGDKPSPYYYPNMEQIGALKPKQYPWLDGQVYAGPLHPTPGARAAFHAAQKQATNHYHKVSKDILTLGKDYPKHQLDWRAWNCGGPRVYGMSHCIPLPLYFTKILVPMLK